MKKGIYTDYFLYFVFSLYPCIHLYLQNFSEVNIIIFAIILLLFFCVSFIILALCSLFLKNHGKAIFYSSIVMVFINFIEFFKDDPNALGIFVMLFVIIILTFDTKNFLKFYRTFSSVLLLFVVFDLVYAVFSNAHLAKKPDFKSYTVKTENTAPKNNIYIILADMYTGSETLEKSYGYDNSNFYKSLEALGFNVFDSVFSNYNKTIATIGSFFNHDYLYNIDFDGYNDALSNASVFRKAKEAGYKTEVITNLETKNTGNYIDKLTMYNNSVIYRQVNLLLHKTIFSVLLPEIEKKYNVCTVDTILDSIIKQNNTSTPHFVFVHLIAPHYPYINPDNPYGQEDIKISNTEFKANKRAYISYLEFVNNSLLRTVETIIKEAKTPPVIVIMGDHGPRLHYYLSGEQKHFKELIKEDNFLKAHYSTFFAIYCPKEEAKRYDGINSLINFSIEFSNARFNENKPRLEDEFYYIHYDESQNYNLINKNAVQLKLKNNEFIPLIKD